MKLLWQSRDGRNDEKMAAGLTDVVTVGQVEMEWKYESLGAPQLTIFVSSVVHMTYGPLADKHQGLIKAARAGFFDHS